MVSSLFTLALVKLAPTIENYFIGTFFKVCSTKSVISKKMFHLKISTKKLNKLHISMKFTYELGGNELLFLDIYIKLNTENNNNKGIQKRN